MRKSLSQYIRIAMILPTSLMGSCSRAVGLPQDAATATPQAANSGLVPATMTLTPLQASLTPTREENPEPTALQPQPTITPDISAPETIEPSPTPTLEIQPTSTVDEDVDCLNQAIFLSDVTIPDGTFFAPGNAFEKTWRVKNTGDCTWQGYNLVFAGGDIMNAALTNPIPTVQPGETADLSLALTAPARGGLKTGNWIFQSASGEQFGLGYPASGMLWEQINVTWTSSGGELASATTEPLPATGSTTGCTPEQNPAYTDQVLALVNQARAANGLPAVRLNSQLSQAALAHSKDMACNRFVDHNGSDGSSWYQRVATAGYSNSASSRENIYVGDPAFGGTPQGAFDWWMNSQVHRDNILNPTMDEIGIGYVYLASSPFGGYYTLLLAKSF